MSLKDAARHMSELHGFDATLRQWERRIAPEKWGFSKYASREDRLKAIDASGKSLLDVSQRGRRKSTASDGRPSLLEDRNLRRFARREVSRESRRRARSVGGLSDQSDQEMSDNSAAPSPAPSDFIADSQNHAPFPQPDFAMFGDRWVTNSSQDSALAIPQIRVFDQSHNMDMTVPRINVSGPDDNYIAPEHVPMSLQAQVNAQYPNDGVPNPFATFQSEMSEQYSGDHMASSSYNPTDLAEEANPAFPWDTSLPTQTHKAGQDFSSYPFEGDASISYTEMLQMGSQNSGNALPADSSRHELFDGNAVHPQEPHLSDTDLEFDPDFEDPTYIDVFALIKERDAKIMQMIGMLKQSCQKSSETEHAMKHVIKSITLLEKGVQAQSKNKEFAMEKSILADRATDNESEQDLRRTLKNISSTQRRATQNIRGLSTQRKRMIEQLKSQIDGEYISNVFLSSL